MASKQLFTIGLLVLLAAGVVWLAIAIVRPGGVGSSSASVSEIRDVAGFAGAAACRDCHGEITEKYETSGHARTFELTSRSEFVQRLRDATFHDKLRDRTFRYHVDADGVAVSLPDVFGDERFPLTYALGSGTHAVTFLTLLPHRDGSTIGLEHRVTYYRDTDKLDLTVGHPYLPEPIEDAEQFGKIVDGKSLARCIGCHTTHAMIRNHEVTELIPHVGCESCHGPAANHARAKLADRAGPDVNVQHRWPKAIDEIRMCGECHRLPESLKPSELTRDSPVLPRFQPAGLLQSRCFTESNGAMRCTTCHDPHETVSHDVVHYEQICLDCHGPGRTTCPKETSRCIDCHLPKVSFEGVAGFHDHWIRIRDQSDPPAMTSDGQSR